MSKTKIGPQRESYVRFLDVEYAPGGRTLRWQLVTNTPAAAHLGWIQFKAQWRRYAFYPAPGTIYEEDCLKDIASFVERRTFAYKEQLKARRRIKT